MQVDEKARLIARYIINWCNFNAIRHKPKTTILKKLEDVMACFVRFHIIPRYVDFEEISEKSSVFFFGNKINFWWNDELVFTVEIASHAWIELYYNSDYAYVFCSIESRKLGLENMKGFVYNPNPYLDNRKIDQWWGQNVDKCRAVGISREMVEDTVMRFTSPEETSRAKYAADALNSLKNATKKSSAAMREFGRAAGKAIEGRVVEDFYLINNDRGLTYPEFVRHQKTQLRETVALSNEQLNYGEEKAATFTSELKTDIVVSKLFQLFIQGHQVKIWRILNPNRRIPGSNRTKRLRKKRNKALAEPAKKVKFSRRNSFALVDPFKG